MRANQPRFTLKPTLLALLLAFPAQQALAANCTWNPANGNWNVGANWSCGFIPTGGPDAAIIAGGKAVTIDDAGRSILTLTNAGTININQFELTLAAGGSTNNNGGVININNAAVLNQFGQSITGGTINTTGTGAVVTNGNTANILSGVTINGLLDATTIANARERIANGMTLNGNVNIANGGIVSLDSTLSPNNSVSGTGTFNLNDAGARIALDGNGTTTLGANIVARGQGNIGGPMFSGGTNNLINNGRISADVSGGTLNIIPGGGLGSVTNNGLFDARGGGTLQLSANINNAAGLINAQNGSVVLQNATTITGGTIGSTGTGVVRASGSANNFLDAVNLTGTLDLTTVANSRERIINGATINGAINVANGGILGLDSSLTTGGNQTISGTGVINLNDAAAHLSINGNGATTLDSGITVRGQGSIGSAAFVGGTNVLTSNGLISADVNGGTLNITAPGNSGSFINNGTLQSINGGKLLLSTNITANAGSQIIAGAGSSVVQNAVSINGVINASGTGVFTASGSNANFLDGVDFTGTLDLSSIANSRERIGNGATINGAINVANGGILGLDSSLTAGGNQTVDGTGVINLNDAVAHLSINGTGSTTLGSGITVRGQGSIGSAAFVGGTNVLTSNGLISSDVAGGTLNITAPGNSGSFINNGTLQAINGGELLLSTNIHANAGSKIISGAGSSVVQNGVTINGVFTSSGGGSFSATGSTSNFLDAVNFTGTLDLTSIANSRERIINGATINGAINVANGGILSLESTVGAPNQTLAGNVQINLNDAAARLSINGNGSTTLSSGVTVRGQGNIGDAYNVGGTNVLTNNGLISADVNGGTLSITAPAGSGSFINNNKMQATNGATLLLSKSINNAGQIIAGSGSTVVQNGVTLNGLIDASGTGVFKANTSGANFLDAVNFTGNLDLASIANSREQIINGATINGVVNVANGGILSLNSNSTAGGSQTLSGTTVINLNDAAAHLSIDGTGSTTLGAGVTVRGQGNIGTASFVGGANVLTNNGLISADVNGGTLSITTPAGSGSFINNATVQAVGGGTLLLASNINNAGGLISVQNGSTAVQNGVTLSGGTLATGGTGVFKASTSGANFLSNVTLNGTLDMTTVANSREQIINGMTFNGDINIANGGILSLNSASTTTPTPGNQTISGTGVINLNDSAARLSIDGNGTTTLASGITVRGQGNIGTALIAGGTNTLVNNGTILADGGTLAIVNPANSGSLVGTGTLQVSGGTLNLVGLTSPLTQGKLVMGGAGSALTLGTQNLTITSDYTNAQSGSGNSFNARAGVSGSGQILAGGGATQVIAGSNITGGNTANATLTINNVHVGANTFNYQINDSSATGPILRGAIQTNVNGGNLTDSHLGGTGVTDSNYSSSAGPLAVTYLATSAGLQTLSGQVLNLTSNFDNIGDQKLNIIMGSGAAAYNLAVGSTAGVAVANQRVNGTTTGVLTVSNTAPSGSFTEALNAVFAGNTGNVNSTNGSITGGTGSGVAGQASNATAMTVGIDTVTAGAKSGTATLNYVSNGTGSSGLGNTAVGSQTVSVTGNVYQIAQPNPSALPATVSLGNFRAGSGAQSQTINIANTNIAPAGFQEGLAAVVQGTSGTATGTGFADAAAGASGALQVGLSGIAAGLNSGAVQVQLQSNGITTSGSNGLGSLNLGGVQTVNVTGTGWRLASANTLGAVSFGNVHVGDTVQQALNITNTAINDGFSEKLTASFGTSSDARITNSGSISQLLAGASDNSSMIVGLNTAAAGTVNGTQTIDFKSDGTGTSGLGLTNLASQIIGVSGDITTSGSVYRLASAGPATPNPVNFGNVRIGSSADQALSISNTAVNDGFSEKLNASISSNGTPVTANGSFNQLAAQSTDNSSLHVGIDTSSAGAKGGSATIALVSDGTGTSGLGTTTLAPQTVNVTGAVYRMASPTLGTPSVTIAARVGDSVSANQAVSITNSSPDIYTEGLKVTASASGNAQSNGGSIANLAAKGTDSSTIGVGLGSTAVAGVTNGQVNLNLASTGAGTTGATDFSLTSQAVNVVGHVYQTAVAAVNTTLVDFGIVHVGDSVAAQDISVTNGASAVLNDVLKGSISASGPFTATGNLGSGLVAGATDASSLKVGLSTGSAGLLSGTALLALTSHNGEMSDLALSGNNLTVTLKGQVNNYAKADILKTGGDGSLSRNGDTITLNLGTFMQGTGNKDALLKVLNDVAGPADLLGGSFDLTGADDFTFTGFGAAFAGLAAGDAYTGLDVAIDISHLGMFSDTITLHAYGYNGGGYSGAMPDLTLVLTANVVAGGTVPEPGTLMLLAIALASMLIQRRRAMLN